MSTVIEPLREEHRELLPHLEHVVRLADEIKPGANPGLAAKVGKVHGFLAGHLLEHARAEEKVLYPAVAEAMGAPDSTATMSKDHEEIGRLIAELDGLAAEVAAGSISPAQARALRRNLYGVYAIVKLHFRKEEEVYLPLLEARLTAIQAARLIHDLEHGRSAAH